MVKNSKKIIVLALMVSLLIVGCGVKNQKREEPSSTEQKSEKRQNKQEPSSSKKKSEKRQNKQEPSSSEQKSEKRQNKK